MQKPFTKILIAIVSLVAVLHFVRFIWGVPVIIGEHAVANWVSAPAGIIAALLAALAWREL